MNRFSKFRAEAPSILGLMGLAVAAYNFYYAWKLSDSQFLSIALPVGLVSILVLVKPRWINVAVAIAVTVIGGYHFFDVRKKETAAFRPIGSAARSVAKLSLTNSRPKTGEEVTLVGKALVWDFSSDSTSEVHYCLPAPLRAKPDDEAITIFMVYSVRSDQVGTYYREKHWDDFGKDLDREPLGAAYRDTAEVAVFRWPGNKLIAWHTVVGDAPPEKISLKHEETSKPVHGDYREPIAQWIQSLRSAPDSPSKAEPAPLARAATPQRTWTEVAARAEAVRRYPQLGVANSPMNRAFVERYQRLKANHPEFLRDPAWPLQLAEEVAP